MFSKSSNKFQNCSEFLWMLWNLKQSSSSKTIFDVRKQAWFQKLIHKLLRNIPILIIQKALNKCKNSFNVFKIFLKIGQILAFHPFGIRICIISITDSFFLFYLFNSIIFSYFFFRRTVVNLFHNFCLILTLKYSWQNS